MNKLRNILMAAALLLASAAISFAQVGEKEQYNSYGYYKDVFMDAGINLTSKKDLPSTRFLGLSLEAFISASHDPVNELTIMDTIIQKEMICGNPWDENGILLYPDSEPRFRVIYMNGGRATLHGGSLTPKGRENIRKFVENGGSYVGTCAGFFISSNGVYKEGEEYAPNDNYLSIWPGTAHTTGLYDSYTAMKVVEGSPLLKYFNFGGDLRIDSLYHWGGAYAYYGEGGIIPEGTEPLMRYVYDTVAADAPTRHMHNQVSSLAYKKSDETGRVVVTGSHPESITHGDRLEYMAAMLLYAMDGNGVHKAKGELQPGVIREMKKNTSANDPLFTKIGDKQYHHFTVNVPEGTSRMTLQLKGYEKQDGFNLSLLARAGDFAFHHNTDIKNVSQGCSKELVIDKPQAGVWYVSVRCENTVETRKGEYGTEYISGREVLNGVPYSIQVDFNATDVEGVSSFAGYGRNLSGRNYGRDGYYKDIFMDSGIQLYNRSYLAAAAHLQSEYEVFLRTVNTLRDTLMQYRCFVGSKEDTNGALLYPDGAARFKVLYVNGGLAGSHGRSLGEEGRERIRQFVAGGGSYLGTCAGAFLASEGYIDAQENYSPNKNYLAIWPGRVRDTYLQNKYLTMYLEKDSPLLKYYDFGGDGKIDGIYHLNGPYAALQPQDCAPERTLPLLRVDYDTIPPVGPSIDNQVTCWAYKANNTAGTVISMSSHPEDITTGERLHLMAAFLQYAMDSNGDAVVKGELVPGEVREMNKTYEDALPAFAKIGDRQYHHFTVDIPKRIKKVTIVLEGYEGEAEADLTLAVNEGDFAFHNKTAKKIVSLGCNKKMVLEKPKAGKLYVSVFCETAPDAVMGDNGVVYTGRTDVLNGVPYKIKVDFLQ